jgi:hypothetical protein
MFFITDTSSSCTCSSVLKQKISINDTLFQLKSLAKTNVGGDDPVIHNRYTANSKKVVLQKSQTLNTKRAKSDG